MKYRILFITVAIFLSTITYNANAVVIAWDGFCTDCTEGGSPASGIFELTGGTSAEGGTLYETSSELEIDEILSFSYSSDLFVFTSDSIFGGFVFLPDGDISDGDAALFGSGDFTRVGGVDLEDDSTFFGFFSLALNFDGEGSWELFVDDEDDPADVGFGSTFSSVPEPSTVVLLGLGLLGFASIRLRQIRISVPLV